MVNGVSLIVNVVDDCVDGCEFLINLILYMVDVMMLCYVKVGDKVNFEVDMIVCYVEWMLLVLQGVYQD